MAGAAKHLDGRFGNSPTSGNLEHDSAPLRNLLERYRTLPPQAPPEREGGCKARWVVTADTGKE